MRRIHVDRGTLRAAGFVALLIVVFLVTNTAVAAAADGIATSGGGLLAPLNVTSSEGAPLDGYQLEADGGSLLNVAAQTQVLLLGGLFTIARLLVGLCCWLIGFVFDFPFLRLLTGPAHHLADAYHTHVVDALGLKGLLLAWAFAFGLVLFVRGKVGAGLGEIALTLVIAALAASAFIRPDYLLGRDGPLDQAHQAAVEVAQITTSSYFGKAAPAGDPCDLVVGPAHDACSSSDAKAASVARPIQDALTDALVVKPYMLLQYGRVLDPKNPDDKAAYDAHLKWIKHATIAKRPEDPNDPCRKLRGPAKKYCERGDPDSGEQDGLAPSNPADILNPKSSTDPAFLQLLHNLDKSGETGKAAAAYAKKPDWDRVGAAVLLLVAVYIVTLMVVSMAVVMLGAQGADAAAAAAGPIVWVWAMLPGPPRTVLWRWVGVFVTSALVTFTTAMALPLFGIAVAALLSDRGPDLMVERLLLLDALAISFKVLHRRIAAAASTLGQRMSMRLQYAKIGGSHAPRGALAASAYAGSLGLRGGRPLALGRAVGEARMAARYALAPVTLAMRGTHAALIGPKPAGRHPAAEALAGVRGHPARPKGEIQMDAWSGEVLHDPATDRPLLSTRLHDRASRLRGYRIAHRVGRAAYGATLGLPRTVYNARQKTSEFTEDARTQLRVTANRVREDAAGWEPVGQAVHKGAVHTGRTVRDTAIGAAIYAAPSTGGRAPGPRAAVTRMDNGLAAASPRSGNTDPAVASRTVAGTTGRRSGSSGTAHPAGAPGAGDSGAAAGADQAAANRARLLALLNARRSRGQGGSR
ncbi:hypothetical protein ACFQ7O_23745 [Streptomyces sp. NPDC056485]|uniref:hypothetical protein n=1 Tax=Streptomyces sp. NPDC056485 TaxID=3345834 RepID=UPI0036798F35